MSHSHFAVRYAAPLESVLALSVLLFWTSASKAQDASIGHSAFTADVRNVAMNQDGEVFFSRDEKVGFRADGSKVKQVVMWKTSPDGSTKLKDHDGRTIWDRESGRRISVYPLTSSRVTVPLKEFLEFKQAPDCGAGAGFLDALAPGPEDILGYSVVKLTGTLERNDGLIQ